MSSPAVRPFLLWLTSSLRTLSRWAAKSFSACFAVTSSTLPK